MNSIKVDNYIVTTPIIEIIKKLKTDFPSHKLKEVREKQSEIVLTCVNSEHANGEEKNPDAHINLDSSKAPYGIYHCFSCDASTDFIGFIALYLDSNRGVAKNWLIKNFGELSNEAILLDAPIDLHSIKKSKVLDESILDQYQHWTPYLAKRKLDRDICEKLKIRYDPKARQVIFPVYDMAGNLKMLARRSIDTKVFYMDADQEKEVYGLNIIQKNNINSCMIVEGPIDMATCWVMGQPAIATLGAISSYQIKQINKSCITHLYLCFDNDDAGRKFTEFTESRLSKRILTTKIDLPKNRKDVNDLTQEEWQELIKKYFITD